jgi:hypothetical protein
VIGHRFDFTANRDFISSWTLRSARNTRWEAGSSSRSLIALRRISARSSGGNASAWHVSPLKCPLVGLFLWHRWQVVEADLLGQYGDAGERDTTTHSVCEGFDVLHERKKDVRAGRIMVADVQDFGWPLVV